MQTGHEPALVIHLHSTMECKVEPLQLPALLRQSRPERHVTSVVANSLTNEVQNGQ